MGGLATGSESGYAPDTQYIHTLHLIKLNARCLYPTRSLLIVFTLSRLNTL